MYSPWMMVPTRRTTKPMTTPIRRPNMSAAYDANHDMSLRFFSAILCGIIYHLQKKMATNEPMFWIAVNRPSLADVG